MGIGLQWRIVSYRLPQTDKDHQLRRPVQRTPPVIVINAKI
jgi:hypothetical protein